MFSLHLTARLGLFSLYALISFVASVTLLANSDTSPMEVPPLRFKSKLRVVQSVVNVAYFTQTSRISPQTMRFSPKGTMCIPLNGKRREFDKMVNDANFSKGKRRAFHPKVNVRISPLSLRLDSIQGLDVPSGGGLQRVKWVQMEYKVDPE